MDTKGDKLESEVESRLRSVPLPQSEVEYLDTGQQDDDQLGTDHCDSQDTKSLHQNESSIEETVRDVTDPAKVDITNRKPSEDGDEPARKEIDLVQNSSSSEAYDVVHGAIIISNGFSVRITKGPKVLMCCDYASIPVGSELKSSLEWTSLSSLDDFQGSHVRLYCMKQNQSVDDVLIENEDIEGVIVINSSDNYHVVVSYSEKDKRPVICIKKSDGEKLLSYLRKYRNYIEVEISKQSRTHTLVQDVRDSQDCPKGKIDAVVNPSQTTMRMLMRRQDQVQYLHTCLFEEETAVILSENPDCFDKIFYGLQQYERNIEPIDVKANTELINLLLRHQKSAMSRDFPFHLCVSYRISKCKRRSVVRKGLLGHQGKTEHTYNCQILNDLKHSCVEKMEVLYPQVVKDTLLKFLSRFLTIPGLDVGTLENVPLHLSRAAKYLRHASSTQKCIRNESGVILYYQKGYVFSRILWTTIIIAINEGNQLEQNWTEFAENCMPLLQKLSSDTIEDIANGIKFGNLLLPDFKFTLTPARLGAYLQQKNKVQPFHQIRRLCENMFPTICSAMEEGSETAFQFFKAIHFIHSAWINGPNRNDVKLSELDQDHIHSSILVINVIKEGLKFIDTLMREVSKKCWTAYSNEMDETAMKEMELLLNLIDLKEDDAVTYLERFHTECHESDILKLLYSNEMIFRRVRADAKKGDIDIANFFPLWNMQVWNTKNLLILLEDFVRPNMRLKCFPWPQLFASISKRHRKNDGQQMLGAVLQRIGKLCRNENRLSEYIMDVMLLNLTYHSSPESALKEFFNYYDSVVKLQAKELLVQIVELLNAMPNVAGPFQKRVLMVLYEGLVPTWKSHIKLKEFHSLQKIVEEVTEIDIQSPMSCRGEFCWMMLESCFGTLTDLNVETLQNDFKAINLLLSIFFHYIEKPDCAGHESNVDEVEIMVTKNVHVNAYFQWVKSIQKGISLWISNIENLELTYSEAHFLKESYYNFSLISHCCGYEKVWKTKAEVEKTFNMFYQVFMTLNHILIHTSGSEGLSIAKMLGTFDVCFPESIIEKIGALLVFPHDKVKSKDTLPLPSDAVMTFRVRFHSRLNELEDLRDSLQQYLKPIDQPLLKMMAFFCIHKSSLFEKFTMFSMNNPDTPKSETIIFPFHLSSLKGDNKITKLALALRSTRNFIVDLLTGEAVFADIFRSGILGNAVCSRYTDLDFSLDRAERIDREFKLLGDYGTQIDMSKHPCQSYELDDVEPSFAGLDHTKNLIRFLSVVKQIQNLSYLFLEFKMEGCLEDEDFKTLMKFVKKFHITSESGGRDCSQETHDIESLTPSQATEHLHLIRSKLHLKTEQHYKCLDIIPVITSSNKLYDFFEKRHFLEEEGRGIFQSTYDLVTRQLQHEEYEQGVLNYFGACFHFLYPMFQKKQNLRQMMDALLQINPSAAVVQLQSVNANLTQLEIWFDKTKDDNVTDVLDMVLTSGNFKFTCTSHSLINIELHYMVPIGESSSIERGSTTCDKVVHKVWKGTEMDEFVIKLGFIDSEGDISNKVKLFIEQNENVSKLLKFYNTLMKLGHPKYTPPGYHQQQDLTCVSDEVLCLKISPKDANESHKVLKTAEEQLKEWREDLRALHIKYNWLLFFSVKKILRIFYLLLSDGKTIYADICNELSFIFRNSPDTKQLLLEEIAKARRVEGIISDKQGAMNSVGAFLKELQRQEKLKKDLQLPSVKLSIPDITQRMKPQKPLVLYHAPKCSVSDIIKLVVTIYDGFPCPSEVMRCDSETTEEDLQLFFKRTQTHPHQYLMLEVDKLQYALQEFILHQSHSIFKDLTKSNSSICFIETSSTIFLESPWIYVVKEEEPHGKESEKRCRENLKRTIQLDEPLLVYGGLGDGKTHFIKNKLSGANHVTIAVNEAFCRQTAVQKLRSLDPSKKECAIYFNFTLHLEKKDKTNRFLEVICWFFFDLLFLGYVEDKISGQSFHLPWSQNWAIYVEVPVTTHIDSNDYLKVFLERVPPFKFFGKEVLVSSDVPYQIDDETQLVCKYLSAYDTIHNGKRRIDAMYHSFTPTAPSSHSDGKQPPPVKFSRDADIPNPKCQEILNSHMGDKFKRNKLLQTLFVRYMFRRCKFLDTCPGIIYNEGRGKDEKGNTTDLTKLRSTLIEAMLKEAKDMCDYEKRHEWTASLHQQLIYDFVDGGSSFGVITLRPDKVLQYDQQAFSKLGIEIPSMHDVKQRKFLDKQLSRAFGIDLSRTHCMEVIDDSAYILTLDYALKLLNIHERCLCRMPVVIEGETGVGKTALMDMLRKLWNMSLLTEWNRKKDALFDMMRRQIQDVMREKDYGDEIVSCIEILEKLQNNEELLESEERCLIVLCQTNYSACNPPYFDVRLRKYLLHMEESASVVLLDNYKKMHIEFQNLLKRNDCGDILVLLKLVCQAKVVNTFHKLDVHAGLTPKDIHDFFSDIIVQAKDIQIFCQDKEPMTIPQITVFMDEVNTASCLGLFKEIITDRSLDGEIIPDNIFLAAACNPHRGDSLATHASNPTWLSPEYTVQKLHPTLLFLKWDYGYLDEDQEQDYVKAKLETLGERIEVVEQAVLTDYIVKSQNLMRKYAKQHILKFNAGISQEKARLYSTCCVSQRDIQRVFTFYQYLKRLYITHKPYLSVSPTYDYDRHALLVSLGLVYYMRLDDIYRAEYAESLNELTDRGRNKTFSDVLKMDWNWLIPHQLPSGIARTDPLLENVFAIIICTMTHTPLVITGDPGSSKTLSFNLAVSICKGPGSKLKLFQDKSFFPKLEPHYYQCSRRTTASEVQKVLLIACQRQKDYSKANIPIYCVMFLDEAGLPEKHSALKILHPYLDSQEISFVAITNSILDAAKTNRAVSLFRPKCSVGDLKTLAKGCLENSDKIPAESISTIVSLSPKYLDLMRTPCFASFFGLRDFIHFVSYLRRKALLYGGYISDELIQCALERNFNGKRDFSDICKIFLGKECTPRNAVDVLLESMLDRPQSMTSDNEVRYKLVIDSSEDDSLVRLFFKCGVLKEDTTKIYICSDFPEDGQTQKVSTISAIRQSASCGHTTVMSQTDDIHESFYDLFNQRFMTIQGKDGETQFFTNIAIGSITKPSRVDNKFQCVVVIKVSDMDSTPSAFLNRFEKYNITHGDLLQWTLKSVPRATSHIVETAQQKVSTFLDLLEGASSFYGLQQETLNSLILSLMINKATAESKHLELKPGTCAYKTIGKEMFKLVCIMEAMMRAVLYYPPTASEDEAVSKCKEVCCIQQMGSVNLLYDADSIMVQLRQYTDIMSCLNALPMEEVDGAVLQAFKALFLEDYSETSRLSLELPVESQVVVLVYQQWLVRIICRNIMQLMTPEALVQHRRVIPSSYIKHYLNHQHHFHLKNLIVERYRYCEADVLRKPSVMVNSATSSLKKLVCFTRSSAVLHSIPSSYPASTCLDENSRKLIEHFIWPTENEVIICKLSSLMTQQMVTDLLMEFMDIKKDLNQKTQANLSKAPQKKILLIIANMENTKKRIINHLRLLIENVKGGTAPRVCVLLLHYPPSMLTGACYPSLFLQTWDHYYLDTIGYPDDVVLNAQKCLTLCCGSRFEKEGEAMINMKLVVEKLFIKPEALAALLTSSVPIPTMRNGIFNTSMSPSQRIQVYTKLLNMPQLKVALCEIFCSYWTPKSLTQQLEVASYQLYHKTSSLSMSDSLISEFKSKFMDFLSYMVTFVNQEYGLDILLCESTPKEIINLYSDLLSCFGPSLPPLSRLKYISKENVEELMSPKKLSIKHTFPFFGVVYRKFETIMNFSHEEACKVLAEAKFKKQHNKTQQSNIKGPAVSVDHSKDIQESTLQNFLTALKMSDDPIITAVLTAFSTENIWQLYQNDFIHHKLMVSPDRLSQQLISSMFIFDTPDVINRVAHMHMVLFIMELDAVRFSSMLRILQRVRITTSVCMSPLAVDTTAEHEKTLIQSLKKPELQLSESYHYVINTMFTAMQECIRMKNTGMLNSWKDAYYSVVCLPSFQNFTQVSYCKQELTIKLTQMHVFYLFLSRNCGSIEWQAQTPLTMRELVLSNDWRETELVFSSTEVDLGVVYSLLMKHLTGIFGLLNCKQQISSCPHYIFTSALILQDCLLYFFPVTLEEFKVRNVLWFFKLANAQTHWANELQLTNKPRATPCDHEWPFKLPLVMSVFKYCLWRILLASKGSAEGGNSKGGPMNTFNEQVRDLLGQELINAHPDVNVTEYIPPYYCHLHHFQTHEVCSVMQQPLAHLYFLILFEYVMECRYSLNDLASTAEKISQVIRAKNGPQQRKELAVLQIEKQAVVQVLIKELASQLDVDQDSSLKIRRLIGAASWQYINNNLLGNECMGGGVAEGHGLMLALHHIRKFKNFKDFQCLMVQRFHSLSQDIYCLKPLHKKVAEAEMGKMYIIHCVPEELKILYEKLTKLQSDIDVENYASTILATTQGNQTRKGRDFRVAMWYWIFNDYCEKKQSAPTSLAESLRSKKLISYIGREKAKTLKHFMELHHEPLRSQHVEPVYKVLFPDSRPGNHLMSVKDSQLRWAVCITIAAMIGSNSNANHLWYFMYEIEKSEEAPLTCLLSTDVDVEGFFSAIGMRKNIQYWECALQGEFSIQSYLLWLWTSYAIICGSLLTCVQPNIRKVVNPKTKSLHDFCANQLKVLWKQMRSLFSVTEEQMVFLIAMISQQICKTQDMYQQAPGFVQGYPTTEDEMGKYKGYWHFDIFVPSWTKLKAKFFSFTRLTEMDIFRSLRDIDLVCPMRLEEDTLLLNLLSEPNPFNETCYNHILCSFALTCERLEIGEKLLSKVVQLRHWMYSYMMYQLSEHEAEKMTLKEALTRTLSHKLKQSQDSQKMFSELYTDICGLYNKYMEFFVSPVSQLPRSFEDITVSSLVYTGNNQLKSKGILYDLMKLLVLEHNSFIKTKTVPDISCSEINDSITAHKISHRFKGATPLLMMMKSCSCSYITLHSPNRRGVTVSNSIFSEQGAPLVDLQILQSYFIHECLRGKPMLTCLTEVLFKFRDKKETSPYPLKASIEDIYKDIEELGVSLDPDYKVPLEAQSHKEYRLRFHSAKFLPELHEVITGLNCVLGNLKKVLDGSHSVTFIKAHLPNWTISVFLKALFDEGGNIKAPSDESRKVHPDVTKIGIHREHFTPLQMETLEKIELKDVYKSLKFFFNWVRDGYHNYINLPLVVKHELLDEQIHRLKEKITEHYKDKKERLSSDLTQFITVMNKSAERLSKIPSYTMQQSMTVFLSEVAGSTEKLGQIQLCICPSVTVKHYVSLHIELRKIEAEGPIIESSRDVKWNEYVLDELQIQFANHMTPPTVGREYKETHGFPIGDREEHLQAVEQDTFEHNINDIMPCSIAESSDLKEMATQYGAEEIIQFLQKAGFSTDLKAVVEQDIDDGEALLDAVTNVDTLIELGITSPLDHLKLRIYFWRELQSKELFYPDSELKVIQFLQTHGFPSVPTEGDMFRNERIDGELLMQAFHAEDDAEAPNSILTDLGVANKCDQIMIKTLFPIWISLKMPECGIDLVSRFLNTEENFEKHVNRFRELKIGENILRRLNPAELMCIGVESAVESLQISFLFRRWIDKADVKCSSAILENILEFTANLKPYVQTFKEVKFDGDIILELEKSDKNFVRKVLQELRMKYVHYNALLKNLREIERKQT